MCIILCQCFHKAHSACCPMHSALSILIGRSHSSQDINYYTYCETINSLMHVVFYLTFGLCCMLMKSLHSDLSCMFCRYLLAPRTIDYGNKPCIANLVRSGPNYIMVQCGVWHIHRLPSVLQTSEKCLRYINIIMSLNT